MDAASQLDLATPSFEHCAVSWGPEPLDGFLSLLIRLPGHDLFIGPAAGTGGQAAPHACRLPAHAYRRYLTQFLAQFLERLLAG